MVVLYCISFTVTLALLLNLLITLTELLELLFWMFPVCLVVPSIPHAAADRQQEALHQSRGVRVRRALYLRRHHPDLPFSAANYRRFDQISPPKDTRPTWSNSVRTGTKLQNHSVLFKTFALFSVRIRIHLYNHDALQGRADFEILSYRLILCTKNALFLKSIFVYICIKQLASG